MKFVGGPLNGQESDSWAGVIQLEGFPDREYVQTLPTSTNWRDTYDHDWFIHGLREAPPIPERVYEWHLRGWRSPEVEGIRSAIIEAADRIFGA